MSEKRCTCGSWAINPHRHGRDLTSDLHLCDVCYWRKRAEERLDRIAALESDLAAARKREQKWIPVSERLPEKETSVLIWMKYDAYIGHTGQADIGDFKETWQNERDGMFSDNGITVTHWMPLPAAPEANKEEA